MRDAKDAASAAVETVVVDGIVGVSVVSVGNAASVTKHAMASVRMNPEVNVVPNRAESNNAMSRAVSGKANAKTARKTRARRPTVQPSPRPITRRRIKPPPMASAQPAMVKVRKAHVRVGAVGAVAAGAIVVSAASVGIAGSGASKKAQTHPARIRGRWFRQIVESVRRAASVANAASVARAVSARQTHLPLPRPPLLPQRWALQPSLASLR